MDTQFRVIWPSDGSEHVMRMRSRPYRDDNANVSRIVGVAWDVTERRKSELSLAKERNLLKTLMDNLPHAIYFKDLNSRFVAVSRALTHSFGKTDPAEIIDGLFEVEGSEGQLYDYQQLLRAVPKAHSFRRRSSAVASSRTCNGSRRPRNLTTTCALLPWISTRDDRPRSA